MSYMREFRYVLKTSARNTLPTGYVKITESNNPIYTQDIFEAKFIDIENEADLELAHNVMEKGYYNLVQVSIRVEVMEQKTVTKNVLYIVGNY